MTMNILLMFTALTRKQNTPTPVLLTPQLHMKTLSCIQQSSSWSTRLSRLIAWQTFSFVQYNVECMAPQSMSAPRSYLLHLLRTVMPFWRMIMTAVAHISPSCCPWTVLPVTLRPDATALQSMRTRISPSIDAHQKAHNGTPWLPFNPCKRMTWLITEAP